MTWGRFVLSALILAAPLALGALAEEAPATQPAGGQLATQPSVFVKTFHFRGNTKFTDAQLRDVLRPYTGRTVTSEQLEDARRALSRFYVDRGFINSGAVLPDQDVRDGVITFEIVEGRLNEIRLQGNKRLKGYYISSRIRNATQPPPLDILKLKDRLELLRQDTNIKSINAELRPGASPGTADLDVSIQETNPFQLGLQFSNRRPPSVGSTAVDILASDSDLTGHGDNLSVRYDVLTGAADDLRLAGANDYSVDYSLPLNASDTTLQVSYLRTDTVVEEAPFTDLNISSRSDTWAVGVRQPLYRRPVAEPATPTSRAKPSIEFAVFASLTGRDNKTFLLGNPFSFSPGADNGTSRLYAVRFGQELITRGQEDALSLRSTFSVGLPVFDYTRNKENLPGGEFISWLGQAQYVRAIPRTNIQAVIRAAGQISSRPLLTIEQFAVGGVETVRGYRENQLVKDQGIVGSFELRVPILRGKGGNPDIFTLVPFYDIGYAINHNADPGEFLDSAGIGFLFNPTRHVSAAVYYGIPFRNIDKSHHDPQDYGVHFSVLFQAF